MPSEEEASSQGAFDPVTGKINWDCPCLGGMAYGPCGMQFREAFSCFVFSEQEPKGIDCVEKFKAMQDCFRENPDVYGEGKYSSLRQLAYFVTSFSNRNYERRRRRRGTTCTVIYWWGCSFCFYCQILCRTFASPSTFRSRLTHHRLSGRY
jgi:CHCH domain